MNDPSNPNQSVHWRDYVDRRLEDLGLQVERRMLDFATLMDERDDAREKAIKVLVEANQRSFDEQGRRLLWFGLWLTVVQIAVSVAAVSLWK